MAPRPRGRPRKKPPARMDAAIDTMDPYGFSRDIVVETIKELQQVYGKEGWPFIEEASYKVLLEAILEKVSGGGTSGSEKQDGETSLATCCEPDANPPTTALQTSTAMEVDSASETNEALGTTKLTVESGGEHLSLVEAAGSEFERLHVQHPLSTGQPAAPLPTEATGSGSERLHEQHPLSTGLPTAPLPTEAVGSHSERLHEQHPSSTSQPTAPLPTDKPQVPESSSTGQRSRRPSYGWMCSDDEKGEQDLVVLRPGALGQEIDNWLSSLRKQKERKQRWDVKPDGM